MNHVQPAGYLEVPAAGKGPTVLVLHAWWGLTGAVRAFCAQLAAEGYVAFAPDLYHGKTANTIPQAEALAGALFQQVDQTRADVAAAAGYLAGLAARPGGLAVIGFSLGAFYALDLSATVPEKVNAVVIFYGTRPGDYHTARAAYLGHFAETDEFEPQEEVDRLEQALRGAGRSVSFYTYPGTGHWFFEADRPQAYHPAAASLAWERTLEFLQEHAAQDG